MCLAEMQREHAQVVQNRKSKLSKLETPKGTIQGSRKGASIFHYTHAFRLSHQILHKRKEHWVHIPRLRPLRQEPVRGGCFLSSFWENNILLGSYENKILLRFIFFVLI